MMSSLDIPALKRGLVGREALIGLDEITGLEQITNHVILLIKYMLFLSI